MVEREVSERFSRASRRHNVLEIVWCALLVVVAVAAFGAGLSASFVSDDWQLVSFTRPEGLRAVARWFSPDIARAWGVRPVVLATSALAQLFGGARAAHVVSLALLVLVAMLLFLEIRAQAFSDPAARRRSDRIWPGALASLLFLVHPANDEVAFWFSAVAYPLAAFFGLLYLRLLSAPSPAGRAAAFGCLALALLSHPAAAAFPVGVAVRSFLSRREGHPARDGLAALCALVFVVGSALLGSAATGSAARPGLFETVKGAADLAASAAWPIPGRPFGFVVLAAVVGYGAFAVAAREGIAVLGLALVAVPSVLAAAASPGILAPRAHFLPAMGVALLLASLFSRSGFVKLPVLFLAVFLCVKGIGVNARRAEAWTRAGALGDEIFAKLLPAMPTGAGSVVLLSAPESLDGAWVYRRGLVERLRLARPELTVRHVAAGEARPEPAALSGKAVLVWDGSDWIRSTGP